MNLSLVEKDLEQAHNNLKYFSKMEAGLLNNIRTLKKSKIVTIAMEYRKATKELEIVRQNLLQYGNIKDQLTKIYDKNTENHKTCLENYKNMEKEINDTKVVLLFDPNRKKSKK